MNIISSSTLVLKFDNFDDYNKNKWFHQILRTFLRIDDEVTKEK